jgi:CBS domain-containing protein
LRELFLPFAHAVNRALADCGFPLCDGEVMAGNPRWCLSQGEWLDAFTAWVRTPEPEALLNAAIFFDFQALAGDRDLAAALRQALSDLTRGNEIFLRMLAVNALAASPPLGRLRDFVTEGEAGSVDLKKHGSRIFVDAARIFALGSGDAATATRARLHNAGANGIIPATDAAAAIHAFHALQGIRLGVQETALTGGASAGNLVQPDALNEFDRRVLLETLRQARSLQQRLKTRFHIDS